MTRYLLDTKIISNVVKPLPSWALLAWLEARQDNELYVAAFTVAEILRGILEMPAGRQRDLLNVWFVGPEGPQALFADRILPFDERAGLLWARLMADGKAAGRPRNPLDMIIASIAGANGCTLVTDNERDFSGMEVVNPLREGA